MALSEVPAVQSLPRQINMDCDSKRERLRSLRRSHKGKYFADG